MIKSEQRRNLFLSDLDWTVMPSVGMAQFRLYRDGDEPTAFVSWGYLSDEVAGALAARLGGKMDGANLPTGGK